VIEGLDEDLLDKPELDERRSIGPKFPPPPAPFHKGEGKARERTPCKGGTRGGLKEVATAARHKHSIFGPS